MIANLEEFCRLFYSITYIPLTLYSPSRDSCCYFPALLENLPFLGFYRSGSLQFSKNPDYVLTPAESFMGFVQCASTGDVILAGPVREIPVTQSNLKGFLSEWTVTPENREEIENLVKSIPHMLTYQFLEVLAFFHLSLNGETLDINGHFQLEEPKTIRRISSVHSDALVNSKENQNLHNVYEFEQSFFGAVQAGNVKKVREMLEYPPYRLNTGTVAQTPLRQARNFFVSLITLTTRNAIAGGMDTEQAYELSDIYIQECEKLEDIDAIARLQLTAVVDFTERVGRSKLPGGMSREVFECIQFISQNTNAPIQVGDVADHIGRSRTYISGKFKEELGFDISRFIMRCKLEEARSLLAYSDQSLSAISNYLCFSSQSYFQTVFKKQYGMTPLQYRNRCRVSEMP